MSQLPLGMGVISDVAIKHYGVARIVLYDPANHPARRRFLDVEKIWKTTTIVWFVSKGDDLLRTDRIELPFYQHFRSRPTSGDLQVSTELMECFMEKPPENPDDGNLLKRPRFVLNIRQKR